MSVADIAKKVGATSALVYVARSKSGRGGNRRPGRRPKVATILSFDGLVTSSPR
jgi:transposase-like protein